MDVGTEPLLDALTHPANACMTNAGTSRSVHYVIMVVLTRLYVSCDCRLTWQVPGMGWHRQKRLSRQAGNLVFALTPRGRFTARSSLRGIVAWRGQNVGSGWTDAYINEDGWYAHFVLVRFSFAGPLIWKRTSSRVTKVSSSAKEKTAKEPLHHGCQTQGPRAECGPPRHFIAAPDGLKDIWSPLYPVLLFWRFPIKWICVLILEKCSCLEYFYSRINNNQMQRELSHSMFGSSWYSASVTPAL